VLLVISQIIAAKVAPIAAERYTFEKSGGGVSGIRTQDVKSNSMPCHALVSSGAINPG
jgi:hypothetical protein